MIMDTYLEKLEELETELKILKIKVDRNYKLIAAVSAALKKHIANHPQ